MSADAAVWITHPDCLRHEISPGHPESPERLRAILDFDVHYGNGTAGIFQNDPRVTLLSTYQDRRFPGWKGAPDAPNLVDSPLAAHSGSTAFRAAAGQRLGSHLLDCLIREARGHGFGSLYGLILSENRSMIDLAQRLGFVISELSEEPGCVRADRRLEPVVAAAATQ